MPRGQVQTRRILRRSCYVAVRSNSNSSFTSQRSPPGVAVNRSSEWRKRALIASRPPARLSAIKPQIYPCRSSLRLRRRRPLRTCRSPSPGRSAGVDLSCRKFPTPPVPCRGVRPPSRRPTTCPSVARMLYHGWRIPGILDRTYRLSGYKIRTQVTAAIAEQNLVISEGFRTEPWK